MIQSKLLANVPICAIRSHNAQQPFTSALVKRIGYVVYDLTIMYHVQRA